MNKENINFLGDMERLVVKPGDRFVIKSDRRLSMEDHARISRVTRQFLGDDARVLILDPGFSLGVIGSE